MGKFKVKVLTWDDKGQEIAIRFAQAADKPMAVMYGKQFWAEHYDADNPDKYRKELTITNPDGIVYKNDNFR